MTGILAAGIILCIAFSAFFSASEMALSSANKIRLENEAEEGSKKAKTALDLIHHFDDTLGAILIGNNLVNIAASSMGSVLVILLTGSDANTWIATVVITISVIIFGETIPKIISKQKATSFSLTSAPYVKLIRFILKPLVLLSVFLVNALTSRMKTEEEDDAEESVEELQTIIETAEDEGVLDEDQTELLKAAIDFADVSAYEVMTARVDIQAIDIEDTKEEILQFIIDTPFTRIPVYEDSIDNIIGVVHLNALLRAFAAGDDFDLRSLLMEPVFIYKTTKLPLVLEKLQETQQHLAIVTDEYSGTDGVISLEDVLEEIVGEIWDENDQIEEEIVVHSENEFELDGDLPIDDFLDILEISEDEFECESDTVGGWVMEILERFPVVGDSFEYENLRIRVTEASDRRVEKVLVNRL